MSVGTPQLVAGEGAHPPTRFTLRGRWGWGLLAFLVFFQWWSRYAGAPVVDFVIDDWRLWKIALSCQSFSDALLQGLNWPDRPLGTSLMIGTFYLLGDFIPGYVLLESLYTAIFLLAALWAVYSLTGDRLATWLFGLVFSLLPNLTESFQWHTMSVSYGLGFAAYVAALAGWSEYLKNRGAGWLVLSALCFAFALGSYEVGILLPAVFLLLGRRDQWRKMLAGGLVFGAIAAVYLVWKFTDGLGTVETRLFPYRGFTPDWPGYVWNAKETVRWWLGARMLECIANGLDGFLTLAPAAMRRLALANLLVVGAALWATGRVGKAAEAEMPPPHGRTKLMVFALAWMAATNVLTVLSWAAGRMNYLPAVGAGLAAACLLRPRWRSRPSISVALVMLVCLMANQGTSIQWRESGIFHRAMYEHLQRTAPEWRKADIVFFDTAGLRNRVTRGLLADPIAGGPLWGSYGNAVFIRGAFMRSMMDMVAPGHGVDNVLVDIEHGVQTSGSELQWHGWYDPATRYTAPLSGVYRIDCQQIAMARRKSVP